MAMHEYHVLELRIGMNVHHHPSVLALLNHQRQKTEKTEAWTEIETLTSAMPV